MEHDLALSSQSIATIRQWARFQSQKVPNQTLLNTLAEMMQNQHGNKSSGVLMDLKVRLESFTEGVEAATYSVENLSPDMTEEHVDSIIAEQDQYVSVLSYVLNSLQALSQCYEWFVSTPTLNLLLACEAAIQGFEDIHSNDGCQVGRLDKLTSKINDLRTATGYRESGSLGISPHQRIECEVAFVVVLSLAFEAPDFFDGEYFLNTSGWWNKQLTGYVHYATENI